MKTRYKVLISFLLGICFIFIGLHLDGNQELEKLSWFQDIDFRWSAQKIDDQEHIFENIRELDLDLSHANVQVHENNSHHQQIKVVARHLYETFEMKQENDTLKIKQSQSIFKRYKEGTTQIDIYVPSGYVFNEIDIDAVTGHNVLRNINTQELYLGVSMGHVDVQNLKCMRELKVDNALGKVDIDMIGNKEDFDYQVSTCLGSLSIDREHYAGFASHKLSNGTGRLIDVDSFAGKINITMEENSYV